MTLPRPAVWLLWLAAYAGTTALLYLASDLPEIRVSHAVLAYMVLIIFASRHGGRALAIMMVTLGYVAVDWFYVPPRFSFGNASDLDWIVLIGFALTGWLVSELFAKQREATRVAEERTREVERLSAERLQLEREASTARVLKEADRLKNALLSSLAHDLRSPIATLSLLADPAAGFSGMSRCSGSARRPIASVSTLPPCSALPRMAVAVSCASSAMMPRTWYTRRCDHQRRCWPAAPFAWRHPRARSM